MVLTLWSRPFLFASIAIASLRLKPENLYHFEVLELQQPTVVFQPPSLP